MMIKHGLLMAGVLAAAVLALPAGPAMANVETGAQAPRITAPDWKVLPQDYGLLTKAQRSDFKKRFDVAKTFAQKRLIQREMSQAIDKARTQSEDRQLMLEAG